MRNSIKKRKIQIFLILMIFVLTSSINAQDNPNDKKNVSISMNPFDDSMRHWYGIRDDGNVINPKQNQPKYKETQITEIADNMLIYQRDNGGWPKNYDMQAILTNDQIDSLIKTKGKLHTTFDNSTTYTHIQYLAQSYAITKVEKYKDACLKGIDFILSAQYPNGGWPQYYPLEDNYSRRITFNDGAYIGIMKLLKKIVDMNVDYTFIEKELYEKVKNAYNTGLDCILNLQILDNGRLTAWCQQHNEIDLKPAWARAFEPPSICNGESVSIVLFLMSIDHPDQKIIKSIQSAVLWFNDSKIFYTRVKTIQAPSEKSKWKTSNFDQVVVIDSLAPPIWTRYYELGTGKPLFCDRNSKYLYSLAEVSRERRSGYGWYTYAPKEALDKYPKWQKKWAPNQNVLNKKSK
jgi:PelA/Pel-15E family pectate lyase